jgi:hypothetical protein
MAQNRIVPDASHFRNGVLTFDEMVVTPSQHIVVVADEIWDTSPSQGAVLKPVIETSRTKLYQSHLRENPD